MFFLILLFPFLLQAKPPIIWSGSCAGGAQLLTTGLCTKDGQNIAAGTFPGSATNNAVVRFDGTGGTTFQDSVVTVADSNGNMAGVGTIANTGTITVTAGDVTLDAARFVSKKNANGDSFQECSSPIAVITDVDNYTILTSDHCKLLFSTGTGTDVFTLLEADTASNIGFKFWIMKHVSGGDVVITPQSGDLLNGVVDATYTLADDGDGAVCYLTAATTVDWFCDGGDGNTAP